MSNEQVKQLFETYVAARRDEQWMIFGVFLAGMLTREQRCKELEEALCRLEAEANQRSDVFDVLQRVHTRLYVDVLSRPKTVNAKLVHDVLGEADQKIKELLS